MYIMAIKQEHQGGEEMETKGRITMATLRKFIEDNAEELHVMRIGALNGLTDWWETAENPKFEKVNPARINMKARNDFGTRLI